MDYTTKERAAIRKADGALLDLTARLGIRAETEYRDAVRYERKGRSSRYAAIGCMAESFVDGFVRSGEVGLSGAWRYSPGCRFALVMGAEAARVLAPVGLVGAVRDGADAHRASIMRRIHGEAVRS
jgi:hypothetical protein